MSKSKSAAAPTTGEKSETVKMVQRHTEYVEADVEGSQAADVPNVSGKNPFREKTAQWAAWENRKRQLKGLPATNNL